MRQATNEKRARVRVVSIGSLLLGSCASGTPKALEGHEAGKAECAVTLEPRAKESPFSRPVAEPSTPDSRVVVHAQTALGPLARTLEQRVPKRLADGTVRIGPGGTVAYSAERGALSVRVSRTALLIEAPVRAKAQACRGDDCYASCEPEGLAVAEVPLMLRSDYGFEKASVSLSFTRGCRIRALGGLLTLDVTPSLEAQLAPELRRVAREIDEQLPHLAPRVAQAWAELSAPHQLPLGGCFLLRPFGVVQGPLVASTVKLETRFAVLARPELRANCGDAVPLVPLPPLTTDDGLPEEGVVRLAMVTPLASLERALEAAQPLPLSGKRLRVAHASITAQGSSVDVQMTLGGDTCGDLGLAAALDFDGDGQHIRLAPAAFSPGERERLLTGKLDPSELSQALSRAASVSPLLSVPAFSAAAPPLAASLSQPSLDVRATVSSARPAGARARGDELVAWLEARGALWLDAKALPPP